MIKKFLILSHGWKNAFTITDIFRDLTVCDFNIMFFWYVLVRHPSGTLWTLCFSRGEPVFLKSFAISVVKQPDSIEMLFFFKMQGQFWWNVVYRRLNWAIRALFIDSWESYIQSHSNKVSAGKILFIGFHINQSELFS